jgi:hypothetical protein
MSVNKQNNSGQERDEATKHSTEGIETPGICTYLLASNEVNNLTAGHRTWKSYSSRNPNTRPTLSGCLMNISVNCPPTLPAGGGERLGCSEKCHNKVKNLMYDL